MWWTKNLFLQITKVNANLNNHNNWGHITRPHLLQASASSLVGGVQAPWRHQLSIPRDSSLKKKKKKRKNKIQKLNKSPSESIHPPNTNMHACKYTWWHTNKHSHSSNDTHYITCKEYERKNIREGPRRRPPAGSASRSAGGAAASATWSVPPLAGAGAGRRRRGCAWCAIIKPGRSDI